MNKMLRVAVGSGWCDVSTASYDSVSFSVSSQDSEAQKVDFSADGTKMYMLGFDTDSVYQYTLSTAWDLSTASYDSDSFSVRLQENLPSGLVFGHDGTKMYILGYQNETVYQYTLSTAWAVNTASYDSVSFSVLSQDSSPRGVIFKSDGTKMYMTGGSSTAIYQYTLSTAWAVNTASYDSVSFSVSSQDSSPRDVIFKSDGTKMYITGYNTNTVYQYTLSTAWDLSTASYDSDSFSVSSQDSSPRGVIFKSDGTKMYITGGSSTAIYQYSLC